jgi:hypothetical protein
VAKERRVVPFRKPVKRKKPEGPEPEQEPGGDEPGEFAPSDFAPAPPVAAPAPSGSWMGAPAAGVLTALGIALAYYTWHAGFRTFGGSLGARVALSLIGAVGSGFIVVAVARRLGYRGFGFVGALVGFTLGLVPWLGWASAQRAAADAELALSSMFRDVSFEALDASMGFAWREKAGKLPLAERPTPEGASPPWEAWASETSLLRPPSWQEWDRGVVVSWSTGPTYAVDAAQVLLPEGLAAASTGEVAWVAFVQRDVLPDGERVDVRVVDKRGTRIVATATREVTGTVPAGDVARLVTLAACSGYKESAACSGQ